MARHGKFPHFLLAKKISVCYYMFVAILAAPQPCKVRRCFDMAKCEICNKGAHFGANVSHSHRRSSHMWKSNIKSVFVKTANGRKKMNVCTSCLRSGKVERA